MSVEPLPPAVRVAFVPFCVASLTRSEIDRVFNAHGLTLPPDANPYSKKNLVDAYCKLFDWRNEQDVQQFQDIVSDVLSLGGNGEQAVQARATFLSVCTRNGVPVEDGQLVNSGTPAARTRSRNPAVRKVLFLASSPVDKARLRLDKEVREIRESLKRSNERDSFELISWFATRIHDLRRGLLDNAMAKKLKDKTVSGRCAAAQALGMMGSGAKDATPELVALLSEMHPSVRLAAKQAIVKIGKPAVPSLVRELSARESNVRLQAAALLGLIGPEAHEAISALENLRDDPEADVYLQAKDSIRLIKAKGKK